MSIYLPIAEQSVEIWELVGIGGGIGVLSGIFGVGGGFLLTPLLILLGIPPAVAVASGANQVMGSSVSGVFAHWRRRNVDIKMSIFLLIGGFAGSGAGVWLFALLKKLGQIDLVISLSYVGVLGSVGLMMLIETLSSIHGSNSGKVMGKLHPHHSWHGLPLRLRFPRSGLYISAMLPIGVGVIGGVLAAVMGVGGGFILVPLMIYVLGMPTAVVVGTSLFQMIFVTANVTLLQAITTHTVDVPLAMILLAGGAVGAQVGARLGGNLPAERLRLLLALIVLLVCGQMALGLFLPPTETYSLG
ncbi:permease [Paramagnetospirillum kuznetsovii]|uniref:Probable membrane transporter protein n=1 Tax=Paramagnetospirillum kuznetsovii TaxID=2053833 RepID=A0A364NUN9_9PROT|nr:sulfite exporter TauE/SafE family protein [Paramagnetospirillum kuznetsovii]RAU20607.1 permease [Paramagnetospirillum kuznetsovii]